MTSSLATTVVVRAAAVALVLAGAAGCGSEDAKPGKVEVDAGVSVCYARECHTFPANGADVTVLDGLESVVRTGVIDEAGRFSADVPPGTYSVRVKLTDLGLSATAQPMQIAPDGGASWSIILDPSLKATALR